MWKRLWAKLTGESSPEPSSAQQAVAAENELSAANLLLAEVLEAHGLSTEVASDWLAPEGRWPLIRAVWNPRENSGRLDIHVLLDNETMVEECFAGFGSGDAGLKDGMHNFMLNSLHVLLAGFWEQNDPAQVLVEEWIVGEKTYLAYIGNFGSRCTVGVDAPPIPHDLIDQLAAALRSEPLQSNTHWHRLFFANVDGEFTFESLLDNDEWGAGLAVLKASPWEPKQGYYSARNFLLLREKSLTA